MLVVLAIVLAVILFALFKSIPKRDSATKAKSPSNLRAVRDSASKAESLSTRRIVRDDYDIWVEVLREDNPRIAEFDLYGTRAALLWKDDEHEVSVVCITQFTNKIPETQKYDHYEFNIKE